MKKGGAFGALQITRAQQVLAADFPDYSIEELIIKGKLNYVARDSFRPHLTFIARTPKEALRKAGVYITDYYTCTEAWRK